VIRERKVRESEELESHGKCHCPAMRPALNTYGEAGDGKYYG